MVDGLSDSLMRQRKIESPNIHSGTVEKPVVTKSLRPSCDTLEKEDKPFSPKEELPVNYMAAAGNSLRDADGCRLADKMTSVFNQYYNNEADINAIKNVMNKTIDAIGQYYVDCGYKKEDIIADIIEDVYERARYCNIAGAWQQSWEEGKQYASMYGRSGEAGDNWTYYDSKYHYMSESMKTSIQTIAKQIGETHGVSDLDLPTEYDPVTQPELYKMMRSYNAHVNFQMCDNRCNGKIVDENLAPPEGFRFFYKGNTSGTNVYDALLEPSSKREHALFDSVLHVWYRDLHFRGRIPTYSVDYAKEAHPEVNMYDAVAKVTPIPEEAAEFMKNCIFFSPYFSRRFAR